MRLDELLRQLDSVLMNPNRLLIVALLYLLGPKKESEVVKALGMSWGKFSTHAAMLEREGYVVRKKVFTRKGYRTFIKLTPEGREAYRRLVRALREFLSQVEDSGDRPHKRRGQGL
ncbi:MAG: transcriptional regulator [Candidatus Altiarchaeales archaeon]|nr:MAG: transcriptional regulator [Candidatus Altiarchaeales archaeon]